MRDRVRRIAVHKVIADGGTVDMCVIEIADGRVVNYYRFASELPFTEWLGGTVVLSNDEDGVLRAYRDGKLIN